MRPFFPAIASFAAIGLLLLLPTSARGQATALPDAAVPGGTSMARGFLVSSTSSASRILSYNMAVSERFSVGINAEYLQLTSFGFEVYGFKERPNWKFTGLPIGVSIEHFLSDPSGRFVPMIGAGVSYYLSLVKTRSVQQGGPGPVSSSLSNDHMGMGWGAHTTLGFRARLYQSTFVQFQGRYRLVDGLAFMGSHADQARFGHFDFVVGLGFSF